LEVTILIFKWLFTYLLKYSKHFLIFIILSIVSSVIIQSIPKFFQYLIDVLLPSRDLGALYWLGGLLAGLLLLNILAKAGQHSVTRVIQEMPTRDLQRDLMDHLRYLGFSYSDQTPVGETLKLFNNDLEIIKEIFRHYIPQIIINGIMLLVTLGFMFSLSPMMSLMLVPTLLIYYIAGPYFSKKSLVTGRQTNELRSKFHKNIYDGVSAITELRVNQREEWHAKLTSDSQQSMFQGEVKHSLLVYLSSSVQSGSSYVGIIAAMVMGVSLLSSGQLTTGAFVAFLFYFLNAVSQSTELIRQIVDQRVLFIQVEKIYEIMNRTADVSESQYPMHLEGIRGEIRIENVSFSYPNKPNVLHGISHVIESGKKVAWVGTSGGGKSTLFKLVGRFYDPSHGRILLDGMDYKGLELRQLRESIGFVFQETYLFGTTIYENIRFGQPDAAKTHIEEAAKAAYAHDFILDLPNGYETEVGERGVKLSGGQKQRIALARMFLKNPPIILLDEATSALDQISEKEVQLALERLCSDRTVIAIAHRLSTVQHFDEIVVIHEGHMVEKGTYTQLASGNGLFAQMVHGGEIDIS
jgi:ATP-binding cassette, subfamily B, bacterial